MLDKHNGCDYIDPSDQRIDIFNSLINRTVKNGPVTPNSSFVTSRAAAKPLPELYEQLKVEDLDDPEVDQIREIYLQGLHEIMRQVSTQSKERGGLLQHVWMCVEFLFEAAGASIALSFWMFPLTSCLIQARLGARVTIQKFV